MVFCFSPLFHSKRTKQKSFFAFFLSVAVVLGSANPSVVCLHVLRRIVISKTSRVPGYIPVWATENKKGVYRSSNVRFPMQRRVRTYKEQITKYTKLFETFYKRIFHTLWSVQNSDSVTYIRYCANIVKCSPFSKSSLSADKFREKESERERDKRDKSKLTNIQTTSFRKNYKN